MKLKLALIKTLVLIWVLPSIGQNADSLFSKRTETYFTFRIQSTNEIHNLTKIISIDNVKNDTVWAYANMEQFLRFSKMGYQINLLPAPGLAPGVVMNNKILLSPTTTWNYYPTYSAYESLMTQFQANYPAICQLNTIATLGSGRKLLVAKISDNVNTDETEPEFLYTSSIHGDETTGYILMLHLMDYLLSNYGSDPEVTDLINNMEIFINPLANPDGTYYGGNSTVNGATRSNANGVDLNRNYPDPQDGQHPDGYAWQPETVAFMDFAASRHFVASGNFHGGTEVVNYPWDTWATLHADDTWWQYVSREYADNVHLYSPATYMNFQSNGVTNGFAWYEVDGGRQDYMNYWHHCREVTVELSDTKLLPSSQLETLWSYNWHSLILYMKQARYGIHGVITDQVTGNPVAARVYISGHDADGSECYSSSNLGDYHRLLKAGTYTLQVSASCYQTLNIPTITVTDHGTTNLNIQLVPGAGVSTTAASTVTASTAISGGNILCDGGNTITARGVCWSVSANPGLMDNYTNDGSGTGPFTSNITGLSASTLYHVRAYATNSVGTTFGNDLTFTTTCGTVTAFPWNENFENAGNIPACWSQEFVTLPGLNWTFITGSGNSHPGTAHGGSYNACLKDATAADNKTRLVSPSLNLNSLINPTLSFWHTQALWSPDQDQLSVYYKTSAAGAWALLNSYTTTVTAWTQRTLSLPNASGDYYIAFEGNARYGYGACVDDVSISGTTKTLAVSPSNQGVTSLAGSTSFTVNSNSAWAAVSNQVWCTVTSSGTGNGTLTATYSQNQSNSPRLANITITVPGLSPVAVTVTQEGIQEKTINLTLLLEGIFNGTTLNKAKNASGDQFAGTIADQITLELHNSTSPYALASGPYTVNVNTDGIASFNVPATLGASYYLVVKHRNSIETWNGIPVSFAGSTVSYNFSSSAGQALGNNLKQVAGKYVIFGGDVNQDGVVDAADLVAVDNNASTFSTGYLATDANGDGSVNSGDLLFLNNNASLFVTKITP